MNAHPSACGPLAVSMRGARSEERQGWAGQGDLVSQGLGGEGHVGGSHGGHGPGLGWRAGCQWLGVREGVEEAEAPRVVLLLLHLPPSPPCVSPPPPSRRTA
eukprot:1996254-Rhodomonas_salina.1